MSTTGWVILAIVVGVVIFGAVALAGSRSRRSSGLRDRFGPEYDRTVDQAGSRRDAERDLREREERHADLELTPLSESGRDRYVEEWGRAERRFVDDPELAAREADSIVRRVLGDRGYPTDDFDTQSSAFSVEHPTTVQRYRHGHDMVHDTDATPEERTENLRQAMIDFRAVFDEQVEPAHDADARDPEIADRV